MMKDFHLGVWFLIQVFNRSVSMRSQALINKEIECNVNIFLFFFV